jgi:L-cysteine/cystine lyase
VLTRAVKGAGSLAQRLEERGVNVAMRDPSTLVSFELPDPQAFTEAAAAEGIVIRALPGRQLARASVGAWNSEEEIERLAELAAAAFSR